MLTSRIATNRAVYSMANAVNALNTAISLFIMTCYAGFNPKDKTLYDEQFINTTQMMMPLSMVLASAQALLSVHHHRLTNNSCLSASSISSSFECASVFSMIFAYALSFSETHHPNYEVLFGMAFAILLNMMSRFITALELTQQPNALRDLKGKIAEEFTLTVVSAVVLTSVLELFLAPFESSFDGLNLFGLFGLVAASISMTINFIRALDYKKMNTAHPATVEEVSDVEEASTAQAISDSNLHRDDANGSDEPTSGIKSRLTNYIKNSVFTRDQALPENIPLLQRQTPSPVPH